MTVGANNQSSLSCENLSVGYGAGGRALKVVKNVTLDVAGGTALGIVGESGSGKSTLALALANCLPPGGAVTSGRIQVGGMDLDTKVLKYGRAEFAKHLSIVFQNPATALDPSRRIKSVFEQRLRLLGVAAGKRLTRATALLDSVKIRDVDRVLNAFPHQLSGGMQQRVVIALALANDPAVLVLDEPTTGLDATVASEIIELLQNLRKKHRAGLVFVSHDIGQVQRLCDDIAVMYGGEIVEQGPANALISAPRHPYTRSLMACLPSVTERRVLRGINGAPPSPRQLSLMNGCQFAPRCEKAAGLCSTLHPTCTIENTRRYECHFPIDEHAASVAHVASDLRKERARANGAGLKVEDLAISYGLGKHRKQILDNISFEVAPGEILAIVGESGSGKSTLLKGILGLVEPDVGKVFLDGEPLSPSFKNRTRQSLSNVRIVFQNPSSALNRRRKIAHQIGRCLSAATGRRAVPADWKASADKVRLPHYNLDHLASSLSGGLLQRVAIACAIAGKPQVIAFDEPTSALDVSVQADILNLVSEQIRKTNAAALFVTHDLAVVRQIADRALVLLHGEVVESGYVEDIFARPQHPYTEHLLHAFSAHSSTDGTNAVHPQAT